MVLPTPGVDKRGSVNIVGTQREVEVYGPELPEAVPEEQYSYPSEASVVADASASEEIEYVYACKDGKCYHLSTCKFAYASAQQLTVYEATFLGYKPCGLCNPPVYGEESTATQEPSEETQEGETQSPSEVEG